MIDCMNLIQVSTVSGHGGCKDALNEAQEAIIYCWRRR